MNAPTKLTESTPAPTAAAAAAAVTPSPLAQGAEAAKKPVPRFSIGKPALGARHHHDTSHVFHINSRPSIASDLSNAPSQLYRGVNPSYLIPSNRGKTFSERVFDMLVEEEGNSNHIVSWNDDSCSFEIKNRKRFGYEILPKYFETAEYSSFRRNIKNYGFTSTKTRNGVIFYHKFFRRDNRDLCRMIRSIRPSKKSSGLIELEDREPQAAAKPEHVPTVAKPSKGLTLLQAVDESATIGEGTFPVAPATSTSAMASAMASATARRIANPSYRDGARLSQPAMSKKRKGGSLGDLDDESESWKPFLPEWEMDYNDPENVVELASPKECKELYGHFQKH